MADRLLIGIYRGNQLATLLPNMTLKGKQTIGNREANVVEVALPAGQPPRLWFETKTGLLVRVEYALGTGALQIDCEDYRSVGGLLLPFAIRQAGVENWNFQCREVKRNEPVEDVKFSKPAQK